MGALNEEVFAAVWNDCHREIWSDVRHALPLLVRPEGYRLAGADAYVTLERQHRIVADRLRSVADRHSTFYWLWFLRRLPAHVFAGELPTTRPYDTRIAEAAAGLSQALPEALEPGPVRFEVTANAIQDIAELAAHAIELSNVQQGLRRAQKGCAFEVGTEGDLVPIRTPLLEDAIALYDERVASRRSISTFAGTSTMSVAHAANEPGSIALWGMADEPFLLPIDRAGTRIQVAHAPLFHRFDGLSNLWAAGQQGDWIRTPGALLLALRVLMDHFAQDGRSLVTPMQTGYALFQEGALVSNLEAQFAEASRALQDLLPGAVLPAGAGELVAELESLESELFPPASRPVHRTALGSCVDVVGISNRLLLSLAPPATGGPESLPRARHFEDAAQAACDASVWRPTPGLRAIRGRHLKRDKAQVTEIDAVGSRGAVALLISCKSVVTGSAYDTGDHATVRNARTWVEGSVGEWARRVGTLRANPVGDNYDFSGFDEIIGVVVTPGVVFVHIGPATAEVAPGLRAACSLDELTRWLRSEQ